MQARSEKVDDSTAAAAYELSITRTFDAPRELVWKAWTDPERLKQWRCPRGFKIESSAASMEPNGSWRLRMDGRRPSSDAIVAMGQHGTIKQMRPPELLVFTFAWDDRSCVGLGESPYRENIVTVRFEERGGKTIMHFHQAPFATESERDGHMGGWNSAFDRFAEFMLTEQPGRSPTADDIPTELHLKRFFAAPLQLVFDAWTQPEMLKQWWGPKNFTNPVCEMDARGGGEIRIHMRSPDGVVYPMEGRIVELYPPHRLHFTAAALDADGKPMFENWNSVFFEAAEGGTWVTLDAHVMNATEAAPQYLKGMSAGWNQSLDKLAVLLAQQ